MANGIDDAQSAVLTVSPSFNASLIGAGPTGAPLQPLFGNTDFKAYNIDFQNRAVSTVHDSDRPIDRRIADKVLEANFSISQALVTDISYANASFYGCSFASYQDTWYTGRNASTYVTDSIIFGQTDCKFSPGLSCRPILMLRIDLFGFGTAYASLSIWCILHDMNNGVQLVPERHSGKSCLRWGYSGMEGHESHGCTW